MKTTLEIILITYNRKSHLRETLNWLFAENSPVKDLDITILNNKSTDGTTELIEEYKKTLSEHKTYNSYQKYRRQCKYCTGF